jgi:aspartate aminotransferase-like enzyme
MLLSKYIKVIKISTDYNGCIADFEIIKEQVKFYGDSIKGVFMTHFETTTGVLSPIEEYREYFRKEIPNALLIVDAIGSFLSEELNADLYDIVLVSSQKGLSLPSGLFFLSVSQKAIDAAEALSESLSGFSSLLYFDIKKQIDYQVNRHTTVNTPNSMLLVAADVAIETIRWLGGTKYCIRLAEQMAGVVRYKVGSYMPTYSSNPGNAVQIFRYRYSKKLVEGCKKEGILIGSGVRKLSDNTFRIKSFGWERNFEEYLTVCHVVTKIFSGIQSMGTCYGIL